MIRITLTKLLDEPVVSDDEAGEMSDAQLVGLLQEDILDLVIDGAEWTIERNVEPTEC